MKAFLRESQKCKGKPLNTSHCQGDEGNINVLGCPHWDGNWMHILGEFDKPVVNGSSWASAQELIRRKNNKENQVCGSEPGPGPTDQGWPLRWKKHCPHCYTEHGTFWGQWGWHEQTFEALRSWNLDRCPRGRAQEGNPVRSFSQKKIDPQSQVTLKPQLAKWIKMSI